MVKPEERSPTRCDVEVATSRNDGSGLERRSPWRRRCLLRSEKCGFAYQLDQACVCFLQLTFLNNRLNRHRLNLLAIICDEHWRLFLDSQRPITLDPNADRACQLRAPIFVRNQFALATLCEESSFDQHRRHFCQTKDGEPGAFDASVILGNMADQGMINASGQRHALSIHFAAGLHAK